MSKTIYKKISIVLVCLLILPVKPASAFCSINNSYINTLKSTSNSELLGYIKKIQPFYDELYYLDENFYSSLIKRENPANLINQIDFKITKLNNLRENLLMFSSNPNISSIDQSIASGILITIGYYRLAYISLRTSLTTRDNSIQTKYLKDFFRYNTLGSTTINSIEKNVNL